MVYEPSTALARPSSPPGPEAEFEAQVPPHTQDDDLAIEVAALEQFVQTRESGHRTAFSSWERRRLDGQANCTRALMPPRATAELWELWATADSCDPMAAH